MTLLLACHVPHVSPAGQITPSRQAQGVHRAHDILMFSLVGKKTPAPHPKLPDTDPNPPSELLEQSTAGELWTPPVGAVEVCKSGALGRGLFAVHLSEYLDESSMFRCTATNQLV